VATDRVHAGPRMRPVYGMQTPTSRVGQGAQATGTVTRTEVPRPDVPVHVRGQPLLGLSNGDRRRRAPTATNEVQTGQRAGHALEGQTAGVNNMAQERQTSPGLRQEPVTGMNNVRAEPLGVTNGRPIFQPRTENSEQLTRRAQDTEAPTLPSAQELLDELLHRGATEPPESDTVEAYEETQAFEEMRLGLRLLDLETTALWPGHGSSNRMGGSLSPDAIDNVGFLMQDEAAVHEQSAEGTDVAGH